MEIYTVEEFQERFDEMIDRVESGEHIGITDGTNSAVMIPRMMNSYAYTLRKTTKHLNVLASETW